MEEADEAVAHNGDKFDLKWLNTRLLFHRIGSIEPFKTVDTLAIVRRRFLFNSNRLDYICNFLFGEEKHNSGGFQTWVDIVMTNSKSALKTMVKYCKKDVALLEKLFHFVESYHKPKSHIGVFYDREKWTCPWTGSDDVKIKKRTVTTAGSIRYQMYSKKQKAYYTIPQTVYNKYLEEHPRYYKTEE